MRLCSRAAGVTSACFGGVSGRLTGVEMRSRLEQQPSNSASADAAIRRAADQRPDRIATVTGFCPLVIEYLDLLGTCRLHPGAAPFLDPPTNSNPPAAQRFRYQTGGNKRALVALGDGYGEVFRPAPPEIDVNRATAFAHRDNLALDQGKPAAALKDPGGVLRLADDINRFGPQAKLAGAGGVLLRQQEFGAGRIAHAGRHTGQAARHEVGLEPALSTRIVHENMSLQAAIAIGFEAESLEGDGGPGSQLQRRTQFDGRKVDHAAVSKGEPVGRHGAHCRGAEPNEAACLLGDRWR